MVNEILEDGEGKADRSAFGFEGRDNWGTNGWLKTKGEGLYGSDCMPKRAAHAGKEPGAINCKALSERNGRLPFWAYQISIGICCDFFILVDRN